MLKKKKKKAPVQCQDVYPGSILNGYQHKSAIFEVKYSDTDEIYKQKLHGMGQSMHFHSKDWTPDSLSKNEYLFRYCLIGWPNFGSV